jgi:threonyl-tRNA synthetase
MSSNIESIRHSLSHILAEAVLEFYPKTKIGMGPAIENGFYYDFQFSKPLQEQDLQKIEEKMREIILKEQKFVKKNITKLSAKKLFKDQPYKLELITELPGKTVSIYESGSFVDL